MKIMREHNKIRYFWTGASWTNDPKNAQQYADFGTARIEAMQIMRIQPEIMKDLIVTTEY